MTGDGESWRTPSGIALATSCVETAVAGNPIVLRVRRTGAVAQIGAAASDLCCDFLRLDPLAAFSPVDCVALAAGTGERMAATGSLLRLIGGPSLRDAVLIVDLNGLDPAPWMSFAGTFATARSAYPDRAAGLILYSREPLPVPNGCEQQSDDSIVDVIDALAAIHAWSPWRSGLISEIAKATAVEVTRGDLDLLRSLADAGRDDAFDPTDWLKKQSESQDRNNLKWRSREETDPRWLAFHDKTRLRRRIWRGQLSVLFPWLEDIRIDFIEKYRNIFPELSVNGFSLEFTPLIQCLRDNTRARRYIASLIVLRDARNELAHGRPISRDYADRLVESAAILSSR